MSQKMVGITTFKCLLFSRYNFAYELLNQDNGYKTDQKCGPSTVYVT